MVDKIYRRETLQKLADIVQRQTKGAPVDLALLQNKLTDLLTAVGRLVDDNDECSVSFSDAVANRPTHTELAKIYRKLTRSKDPLNSRWFAGIIVTEMEVQAQLAWAKVRKGKSQQPLLSGKRSDQFSPDQLDDIKRMAATLARYHSGLAPPGSRQKTDQDTLLMHLADFFLEATGLSKLGRFDLPYATGSHFIQFAHVALKQFFDVTEVSVGALSKRWERLVERHRLKPGPVPKNSIKSSRKRLKRRPKKPR